MTDSSDLWETQLVVANLSLELRAGDHPALVLVQDDDQIPVDLASAKVLVARAHRRRGRPGRGGPADA
jgi:hypothetical protein